MRRGNVSVIRYWCDSVTLRQVLADQRGHLAAAVARRIDHVLGFDRSGRGSIRQPPVDSSRMAVTGVCPVDRARDAGALGERLCQLRPGRYRILGIRDLSGFRRARGTGVRALISDGERRRSRGVVPRLCCDMAKLIDPVCGVGRRMLPVR